MTEALTLRSGALRCDLLTGLGGSVAGLWWDEQPVLLADAGNPAGALQTASYPLLPYSNRVGYRRLQWAGTDYLLAANFPAEPHTIHGVAWERGWRVQSHSAQHAELTYAHAGDASWPFAFEAQQTIRLSPQAINLQCALTNRADHAAPGGLGWHPYFAKRARSRIQFAATGRWEMGPDKLPTERRTSQGLQCDCATLAVDHCFDGWNGTLLLEDEVLRLRLYSDLRRLVIYTTPERHSIAIEPVSHVNNALALARTGGHDLAALGMRVLQPGERLAASLRIEVETVA